jgi:arsenate reductase (thioredoxin)
MPIKRKTLFLCTGNSARSIFGEYLLNKMAGDRLEAYSAGSEATGLVNPLTIKVLKETYGIDASRARSKSWDESKNEKFDFVITVCDEARVVCPTFPGNVRMIHWNIPDPASIEGDEGKKIREFKKVAQEIQRRIELFVLALDRNT